MTRKISSIKSAVKVNRRMDIHYFKRSCVLNNINFVSGTQTVFGSYTFKLDDLSGVSEFGNLFDMFKITGVALKFYLNLDPAAQAEGSSSPFGGGYVPRLHYVVDHDDANVPASLNSLREATRHKVVNLSPYKPVRVFLKPSVLSVNIATPAPSDFTYSPKWNQWLDIARNDTRHYGLKWAVDNAFNNQYIVNVEATYYVAMKDAR